MVNCSVKECGRGCSVSECPRKHDGHGYCKAHNKQIKKHGKIVRKKLREWKKSDM